jgi:hypothetical protein
MRRSRQLSCTFTFQIFSRFADRNSCLLASSCKLDGTTAAGHRRLGALLAYKIIDFDIPSEMAARKCDLLVGRLGIPGFHKHRGAQIDFDEDQKSTVAFQ